jgi:hypothetical protein
VCQSRVEGGLGAAGCVESRAKGPVLLVGGRLRLVPLMGDDSHSDAIKRRYPFGLSIRCGGPEDRISRGASPPRRVDGGLGDIYLHADRSWGRGAAAGRISLDDLVLVRVARRSGTDMLCLGRLVR